MSDVLRNFLFLKDPLGKGQELEVSQAELAELLGELADELAGCINCECYDCEPE